MYDLTYFHLSSILPVPSWMDIFYHLSPNRSIVALRSERYTGGVREGVEGDDVTDTSLSHLRCSLPSFRSRMKLPERLDADVEIAPSSPFPSSAPSGSERESTRRHRATTKIDRSDDASRSRTVQCFSLARRPQCRRAAF